MAPEHKSAAQGEQTAHKTRRSGRVSLRFFVLSAIVHMLLSVALAAAASDSWIPKKLDVVWLDLDNRLGVPQPAATPKVAPPPTPAAKPMVAKAKSSASKAKKKKPKPKPKKKPIAKKKPATRVTPNKVALDGFVPGHAALMLLVRTDRVRGSPYSRTVRRLLEVFYDYKMLLWKSGIDPIQDFDALLIATPNPYRVTTTFLAGRFHKGRAAIKRGVSRSASHGDKTISWSPHPLGELGHIPSPPRLRQDPRKVLLREGLVMIVNPRDIAALARPRADANKQEGTTLVDRLHDLDAEGGKDRRAPGLQLQALNLRRLVRLPADLPPPLEAKVTIPATAPSLVRAVLRFASDAQAEQFFKAARGRLEAAQRNVMLRLLGVGSMLGRIKMKRKGRQVSAHAKLSAGEVRDLLEMFRGAIPQIHIPGMAPRRPPTPRVRPRLKTPKAPGAGQKAARPLEKKLEKGTAPAASGAPRP